MQVVFKTGFTVHLLSQKSNLICIPAHTVEPVQCGHLEDHRCVYENLQPQPDVQFMRRSVQNFKCPE